MRASSVDRCGALSSRRSDVESKELSKYVCSETILATLDKRRRKLTQPYYVPGLWVDARTTAAQRVDPPFYADCVRNILNAEPVPLVQGPGGGEWSRHARVYNLFPRV